MYTVTKKKNVYEIYELRDTVTNSWFRICPERGGIVLSYGVNGKEILYLDESTFIDPSANVRGGIPVLFPICGQLTNGEYQFNNQTYHLKNHGIARVNSWLVDSIDTVGHAAIALKLASNTQTFEVFPFHFELSFRYTLEGGKLTIYQSYQNCTDVRMPMYAGFHPYFKTVDKMLEYKTDATRYLDCNDNLEKTFDGTIDLTDMIESAILLDTQERKVSFSIPCLKSTICMEYGDAFKYIVLWSVKDKSFVCVEPWMAMPDAFNTEIDLQYVDAGKILETYFSISVQE